MWQVRAGQGIGGYGKAGVVGEGRGGDGREREDLGGGAGQQRIRHVAPHDRPPLLAACPEQTLPSNAALKLR